MSRGPVKWWLMSTGLPPFLCSHVAWSYQAVNTKTNYSGGNFTAKEDLSSTKAFSLSLSLSMYILLSSYFKELLVVEGTRKKEERGKE